MRHMAGFPSSRDADLFCAGLLPPEDLPDDARPLGALFATLRNHVETRDPEQERQTIVAIADGSRRSAESTSGTVRTIGRRMPARAAALAFAAVLVTGTAAAAVTGSLPDPVQRAVSSVLSRAHISVPTPDDHSSGASSLGAETRSSRSAHHSWDGVDHARGSTGPRGPTRSEGTGLGPRRHPSDWEHEAREHQATRRGRSRGSRVGKHDDDNDHDDHDGSSRTTDVDAGAGRGTQATQGVQPAQAGQAVRLYRAGIHQAGPSRIGVGSCVGRHERRSPDSVVARPDPVAP